MNLSRINYNITTSLIFLISFTLPLHKRLTSFFIVLLFINWLFYGNFKKRFQKAKDKWLSLIFISLYLFYCIGMLYSSNLSYGWFDLEVKLSLIIFPVLIITLPKFNISQIFGLKISFIVGCFIAVIFCLGTAYKEFNISNDSHVFFYSKLSLLQLPSYFAMYLCFSIVLFFYLLLSIKSSEEIFLYIEILIYLFIVVFSGFIILLSSVTGIITYELLLTTFIFIFIVKKKRTYTIISIILLLLFNYFSYEYLTLPLKRLTIKMEALNTMQSNQKDIEKKEARLLIWREGVNIIKTKPFFGVGTGDVKDELLQIYLKNNITRAYNNKYNAHNQYIQTGVALGISGLLVLLGNLLIPLWLSFKRKNYVYVFFLFIVAINFLFESMLETQAGVVFYAFFNSLLAFSERENS